MKPSGGLSKGSGKRDKLNPFREQRMKEMKLRMRLPQWNLSWSSESTPPPHKGPPECGGARNMPLLSVPENSLLGCHSFRC